MPTRARIDVDGVPDDAFSLAEEHGPFSSDWHAHAKHQLLYAASGVMILHVAERRWTLPPLRAAWIPARESHMVRSATGISLRTVYLKPRLIPMAPATTRVFAISPLAREMILFAMKWGPRTSAVRRRDGAREPFFRALAALVIEWIAEEKPYFLPEAKTPELARALDWIGEHLAQATIEGAAEAAHVSERTLARRFEDETGASFRAYLQAARMMRAMELLAAPRASVTATAFAVGFRSLGAFTTAFRERCGETPTAYRERAVGSGRRSSVP